MRKIFIIFIIGQLIGAIITYGICYFCDYSTLRDAVDVAFFVGAGIVFIGYQVTHSASTEDSMIYLSTRYTGDGRQAYEETEQDDVRNGIHFGWFVVVSGFIWAFLSYGIYYIFDR